MQLYSLKNKNACNIKYAFMPNRFLPDAPWLTRDKSGLARRIFFFESRS